TDWIFVPPAITVEDAASVDYSVGAGPVHLAPEIALTDVELDALNEEHGNWSGAKITVRREGGANAEDVFGHQEVESSDLVWNGSTSGTITKGDNQDAVIADFTNDNGELHIHFTGYGTFIPTTGDVNELLRQITYSNNSPFP